MSTYRTMTPKGMTGSTYDAPDAETAAQMAEADGYRVLDVMDDVLVIPDEDDGQVVCEKHGPQAIVGEESFTGYAGGRCYVVMLACGCADLDESDDIRAAY